MKSVKHKYISGQKFEVSWRGKLLLRQNTSTHICSEVDICTSSKYIAESNTDLYFHRKYKYRLQWWTALEEYFHIDRKYCNSRQTKYEGTSGRTIAKLSCDVDDTVKGVVPDIVTSAYLALCRSLVNNTELKWNQTKKKEIFRHVIKTYDDDDDQCWTEWHVLYYNVFVFVFVFARL